MKVTRLSTTPIKGLALHHPTTIEVNASGAVGDRLFHLVDDDGALVSITAVGGLASLLATFDADSALLVVTEQGTVVAEGIVVAGDTCDADFFGYKVVAGRLTPGPWDAVFSERAGQSLRLVMADSPAGGHDVEPLSLLSAASTAALSAAAGLDDVDSRRFRMLVEFDGVDAHAEDLWLGRQLQVGSAVLEVGSPVQRCAATTRNPDTGEIDLKTLSLIGSYRGRQESIFGLGFNFGVYARCVTPGVMSVGDPLTLVGD